VKSASKLVAAWRKRIGVLIIMSAVGGVVTMRALAERRQKALMTGPGSGHAIVVVMTCY